MSFPNSEYLVSTAWLAEHREDPDVRILDVTAKLTSSLANRAESECYDEGHIPGSHFFDVSSSHGVLSDKESPLPWMWPAPEAFVETMADFGIDNDTKVVIVARTPRPGLDSGTMWCTRAWWTMHHMGVTCSILQGGIESWESEGRDMATDTTPAPQPGAAFLVASDWDRARASKQDVLAAGQSGACVIDALPADSFDGTGQAYGPRSGHIAGAANLPFRSLVVGESADFIDPAAMASTLGALDLLNQPNVITYCGGAIAATVDAFCLALFGHDGVSVYDGSLMEWSADPELPMTDPSQEG